MDEILKAIGGMICFFLISFYFFACLFAPFGIVYLVFFK